jgi:hypothetical protein
MQRDVAEIRYRRMDLPSDMGDKLGRWCLKAAVSARDLQGAVLGWYKAGVQMREDLFGKLQTEVAAVDGSEKRKRREGGSAMGAEKQWIASVELNLRKTQYQVRKRWTNHRNELG